MEQNVLTTDTKLDIITDTTDPLTKYIKDDPVRPDLSVEDRISKNKEIIAMVDKDGTPMSMVCVCYQNTVPTEVAELNGEDDPTIAIFYTIWSYAPGAGKKLIFAARDMIKERHTSVKRFVTLSPCSDLARKFHTANGATVLSVNTESVNYEYPVN